MVYAPPGVTGAPGNAFQGIIWPDQEAGGSGNAVWGGGAMLWITPKPINILEKTLDRKVFSVIKYAYAGNKWILLN
jgi:hypothetical protein